MSLLAIVSPGITVCPQCGDDWMISMRERGGRSEYCPRCGSPVGLHRGFDPLSSARLMSPAATRPMAINKRAKLIVRFGILGLGLVGLLTGLVLCYGGWISPDRGMDVVQLWISRIGGPILLAQGVTYAWLPFRRPVGASILRFTPRA